MKTTSRRICLLFGLLTLTACATIVEQVEVKPAIWVADGSRVKPVAITKVVAKMKKGEVLGKIGQGALCIPSIDIVWRADDGWNHHLKEAFLEELEANGRPVVRPTDDLFSGPDVSGAEVIVAARITGVKAETCQPLWHFLNFNSKGSMKMDVEWQVYSPARRTLIGTVQTQGSALIEELRNDTLYELEKRSFGVATNNLLASREFMAMVDRSSGLIQSPEQTGNLLIENKKTTFQTLAVAIAEAKKSTVTIRTDNGHGSGFAIGGGDLILTNAHVVGEASNVALVTSGGLSINGSVAKVSKERDVALIKINGARLQPLYVQTTIPAPASQVFAIGSPLYEQLSGSVTSGIVSGTRMLDGYSWIQSDTAISPGNSGGPLLDNAGSAVGISTAGFQSAGSQVGLNLFIPIGEALIYVGLKGSN